MNPFGITADQVRAERERSGDGMAICKHRLECAAALRAIDAAEDLSDVRHVLRWLAEAA